MRGSVVVASRPACRRRAGSRTSPERKIAGPSCRIPWGRRTSEKVSALFASSSGRSPARGYNGVPDRVAVLVSCGQVRIEQAGRLRRNSVRRRGSEHGERVRQFSIRAAVSVQRRGNRTQIGDRGVFARVQIGLLPLLGHRGNVEQDQPHREQLPASAFAHEAKRDLARVFSGDRDFHRHKGEIFAHARFAEAHFRGVARALAAHDLLAVAAGGKQRPFPALRAARSASSSRCVARREARGRRRRCPPSANLRRPGSPGGKRRTARRKAPFPGLRGLLAAARARAIAALESSRDDCKRHQ